MMPEPLMIGWWHSRFGRLEGDLQQLLCDAVTGALVDADLAAEDVDGIFVGVFGNGFQRQRFEAGLVGMGHPELAATPAVRVENACATGSAAIFAALDFLAAGRGRIAVAVGAEKMTAIPAAEVSDILQTASYVPEEGEIPAGFAGVFGRIVEGYFQRYGDNSAELAMIAAKNHANAVLNPFAHLRKDMGFDFCNTVSDRNPRVAGPLRRTDCSLISDGAAAVVIATGDVAASARRAIGFRARGQVNDAMALSRRDPTEFAGARAVWRRVLTESGMGIDDLDMVETHDCFTIAELIQYEAMGLTKRGQGGRAIRDGITRRDGRLPVNPSGGLKARGHPIGATGVSQHVMAAMQLAAEAGEMQLPDVSVAGVFNMGGAAVANYASILERVA